MTSKSHELVVGDVADVTFVSLDENAIVAEAAKSLYERESDTIIVTRNEPNQGIRIPVGIVTQRDLVFRVVAQNRGPFKVTLGKVMSSPVTVIQKTAPVKKALKIMKEKGFSRLPVVTQTGEIVGLITMKMVIRKLPLSKMSL